MHIEPYLFFEGRSDEAIAFYKQALGAEVVMLMRFKENPDPGCQTANPDKVMHAALRIGAATIFLSDGRCQDPASFKGFSLSLSVSDDAEARQRFAALCEGGQVMMPLAKTFFSSQFGMVTDRFGVLWMVLVAHA